MKFLIVSSLLIIMLLSIPIINVTSLKNTNQNEKISPLFTYRADMAIGKNLAKFKELIYYNHIFERLMMPILFDYEYERFSNYNKGGITVEYCTEDPRCPPTSNVPNCNSLLDR